MTDWFKVILPIHIVIGWIALVIGPMAMVTVKGGLWHRRWGRVFFWSMAGVAVTATLLCWLRSGLFLFLIAIFSFYMALTGYRALRRKRPEVRASLLDWSASVAVIVASIGMICMIIQRGFHSSGAWVGMVFGMIGIGLGSADVWNFLKAPRDKKAWLNTHFTRFLAAYIATVSAFSVVNFQFLPTVWRWLWPTIFGTVGIIVCRAYYNRPTGNAASIRSETIP